MRNWDWDLIIHLVIWGIAALVIPLNVYFLVKSLDEQPENLLEDNTCTYTVTSEGYDGRNFTLALDSECGEMLIKIDENYFGDINYTLEGGH